MKNVKWIFVVLLTSSLTSFINKDKPTKGLTVGSKAPDFTIEVSPEKIASSFKLSDLRGKYVLINFWASYDAQSRMDNVLFSNVLLDKSLPVELVSISFDDYSSIYEETIRKDQIIGDYCFLAGNQRISDLFKKYQLKRGLTNFLLDERGVIVAKNLSVDQLTTYFSPVKQAA